MTLSLITAENALVGEGALGSYGDTAFLLTSLSLIEDESNDWEEILESLSLDEQGK